MIRIIGFILFWTSLPGVAMEKGKSPVTFYDTYEFGFHSQNWSIKQHTNGLIYAANGENLLVFDGTNWRGLLEDTDLDIIDFIFLHNRIYVGGRTDIGYLEADQSGQWQFHSLKHKHAISDLRKTLRVLNIEEHVVFLTNKSLWVLRPDNRFERYTGTDFVDMWQNGNHLLVLSKTQGVKQFNPITNQWDKMTAVNRRIEGEEVKSIVPLSSPDDWLLISAGTIYSHRNQATTPLKAAAQDWLRRHTVKSSVLLHNGDIALGGISGGILIINSRGEVQWIINKNLGYNRLLITGMTVDHQGNLWTTHRDRGISKVEIGAGSTDFDVELGINNSSSLARFHGKLFATSFFGLHVLVPSAKETKMFKLLSKQKSPTFSLVVAGDELIFADLSGLQTLAIDKGEMRISRINHESDIGFVTKFSRPLHGGKRVYANTDLGVIRLQQSSVDRNDAAGEQPGNRWQVSKLNGFHAYTEFVEQDRWGNLWVGSRNGILYKVSDLEQWPDAHVERMSEFSKDNAGNVHIYQIDGEVIISTVQGVFQIENGEPQPDERFSELHRQYGFIHRLHKASGEASYWVCFASDRLGKLTLADGKLDFSPVERTNSQPIQALFEDQGKYLWLAHNGGVSRIELSNRIEAKKFAPRAGLIVDQGSQFPLNYHVLEASRSPPVLLPPGRHDLRFYLEIPHYSSLDRVQVRGKLEGFQQRWSNWSSDTYFDYTGLGHGDYTWFLEARYQDGTVLRSSAVDLTIAPYWYEQMWVRATGLALALLLLIAAIYGLFYWRITVLKRQNRMLEIMVDERTKAIRAKNKEITALHERKTRFFYYISHEFRTPLALIMGAHEAILGAVEKSTSKLINGLVNLAHTNSQRLNQLINRLLDQHLAERGQLRLCVEQHQLGDFLRHVIESFSYECQQRQVKIELVNAENLTLWFDREHMISIFYNIISNALKYSRVNGEVRISAAREGESAKITVADNGIGIPKEVLNKVFSPYYRHKTATQESRGHGLGLAFSKTLAELHGGRISLESDTAGTCVSVFFPLGRDHFKPESLKKSSDTSPSGLDLASICYLPDEVTVETSQQTATLLVVDDNYELCQFIKLVLQNEFTVVTEYNGLKALDYCKRTPPDLIIADVMMPVLDGIEMTKALKAHQPTADIPIILLTALADKPSVVKGLEAGADDYLSKPFHVGELKLRITRLLCFTDDNDNEESHQLPSGVDLKSAITVEINLNSADPNYSVDAMAKNLGLDRHNLYRYVRDHFDQSPTDLLLRTRLDKAKRLVESKDVQIGVIAYECGFNSVSYFNRSFKKRFHLTPTAWRKEQLTQVRKGQAECIQTELPE